ncbi:MAG: nucleotidyltransferase domain-containing protein [Firmicutes bacterium]|jgi:predicted nucleotidyltransferase|nr:nucleotidyltransferase domain-containing protein [Bacillota bacterium]HPU01775.1 nucleotidyltransferase domain-containing protein [Bacillota bacterium]
MGRLSKKKNKINIDTQVEKIKQYFLNRQDVAAALLFGSYGSQYQTPLSDVDIAVPFNQDKIRDKIQIIKDNLAKLKLIQSKSLNEF